MTGAPPAVVADPGSSVATQTGITASLSQVLAGRSSRRRFVKWLGAGALATGLSLSNPVRAGADSGCGSSPHCCGNCNSGCSNGCWQRYSNSDWWQCSNGCYLRCTWCRCSWGNCHCGWHRTQHPCQPYAGPCNCPV